MRKATKTIISFAVVLIAGLNFIVLAFAQDPFSAIAIGGIGGASGAGLFGSMAGMSGIDISWNQAGADPLDAMWNVLNPDHVYFSGEKHEADPVQDPEDIYDYITVDIGDWLSAQSDFITTFIRENNVTDNDSGSISVNELDGITCNQTPPWNNATNQVYCGKFAMANVPLSINGESNAVMGKARLYLKTVAISGNKYTVTNALFYNNVQLRAYNKELYIDQVPAIGLTYARYANNPYTYYLATWDMRTTSGTDYFVNAANGISTSVPWTSTTVDDSVFDGWESARVKIPHSISGLSPGWTVPDFTNALNDLWTTGQQGQIVIEDTDQPVPPPPVPTTPLGEVPFDDWVDLWGQGIYQQLENQSDALDLIGSNGIDAIEELESIDTNTEDLVEVAESIDTNIGVGNGILGGIKSLAQSAVNYLEGIAEHVGELVEEIVEGTETLIAGILNQIPQVFSVIFGPIKQASSIWHYVVEWITSIGAPFQFIWSMASGTSYYVILPVYASLAAAVVLAFYKRFGK